MNVNLVTYDLPVSDRFVKGVTGRWRLVYHDPETEPEMEIEVKVYEVKMYTDFDAFRQIKVQYMWLQEHNVQFTTIWTPDHV